MATDTTERKTLFLRRKMIASGIWLKENLQEASSGELDGMLISALSEWLNRQQPSEEREPFNHR